MEFSSPVHEIETERLILRGFPSGIISSKGSLCDIFISYTKKSHESIGKVGIHTNYQWFGWFLSEEYRRQGYTKEALKALIPYFMAGFNKKELYAWVNKTNKPSQATALSVGFKKLTRRVRYQMPTDSYINFFITEEMFKEKFGEQK